MSDQEINESVAKRLGWARAQSGNWMRHYKRANILQYELPNYVGNLGDASEILEWLIAHHKGIDIVSCSPTWTQKFPTQKFRVFIMEWSSAYENESIFCSILSKGICLAFLKLP